MVNITMILFMRLYHHSKPIFLLNRLEVDTMGKARRKMRPQPPKWWTLDNDNCWFCKNRNNCGGCKLLKEQAAKERKKHND